MGGRITGFFREFVLAFSIILTVLGILVIFIGVLGIQFPDIAKDIFNFTDEFLEWSFYLLIIGFIIFAAGIWYLYSYFKNRKFILEEIKTNKRSELLKKHGELKNTVRHMPSKYQRMLKSKEEELKI